MEKRKNEIEGGRKRDSDEEIKKVKQRKRDREGERIMEKEIHKVVKPRAKEREDKR